MRKKRMLVSIAAVLTVVTLLVNSTPASATVTSFGKWASRTKTMYVNTSSATTPWAAGANKWKTNTNFNISTTLGTSSTYYAVNVNTSMATWDGLCTFTVDGGIISQATLNINTYYTSQSKYTSSIITAVAAHEVGHSLGLEHTSVVETTSIMHPYTFNSNGTTARALNPSANDISVVNGLYPLQSSFALDESSIESEALADGVYVHPSWSVYYEDEASLTEAADLVVRGQVVKEKGSKYKKGDYKNYKTDVNVGVLEVLKGEYESDQPITLSQMGGTDGDVTVFSDMSTYLKKGQEVILFLRKMADGTYIPINEDDGIYVADSSSYANIASSKKLDQKKIK
ncbi:matrixin family metalloprotease [Paenibacillus sp. 2TAB19]|uniref:matrixin family metalloprotease n=1 Tax=Paenibacillus sp. 2TAB19 TaxID=3233003 RepID=UPI003F955D41